MFKQKKIAPRPSRNARVPNVLMRILSPRQSQAIRDEDNEAVQRDFKRRTAHFKRMINERSDAADVLQCLATAFGTNFTEVDVALSNIRDLHVAARGVSLDAYEEGITSTELDAALGAYEEGVRR